MIKKTFWFFVFNWGTLDIGKSNDNVQPYGVSYPVGCPTPWGFLSYGVSYPVGCPTLWGFLPNGASYPMGFPAQWGFLPYGVSYPMGCPTLWGIPVHLFIYLTNTEFWEETPWDHKVKS